MTNPLRDVTSRRRGICRVHPPDVHHHGTQEECSDEEHEKSVVKNMSQNSDIKPERKSIQGRAERQKALADGTLCTGSLQRLTNMLMTMQNESEKMAEELEQAQKSSVIGPAVITNCTTVKTKLDAALAELQTYKDNNKEVETATVLKTAKQHLADSRKQFTIVRKILSLKCPVSHAKDVIVNVDL